MSGIMGFPYFNYLQLFYLIMLCSTQTIFKSKLQKLLVFTTKKKKKKRYWHHNHEYCMSAAN